MPQARLLTEGHGAAYRTYMSFSSDTVHLAGRTVAPQQHVCAFFQTREQEYRTLLPFVQEGFERGEKAIHVVDPALRDDHMVRLATLGIDVAEAERRRQLEVFGWDQAYLFEGQFDRRVTSALFDTMLRQARVDGFPRSRVIGHGEWALPDHSAAQVEYEARMNDVLPAYDDPIVCAYDRRSLAAGTMTDLLRAHPTAIVDGALIDNPSYMPAARFVARLHGRPLIVLCDRFRTALLAGARPEALEILIDEALDADIPVPRLYLEVVQPALQEIGRLRQGKRISEVQVNVAVDIVETALTHLHQLLPTRAPGEHTVIVACVEGEQHDLGARMVAHFLEMVGFNVTFLRSASIAELEQLIRERPPHLLALSATTTASLRTLQRTVAAVRRVAGKQVPIAVGGRAILERPTFFRRLAAQMHARDADGAATAACRLLRG